MQYTTIGRTDIMVSRFCLGCMGFGKVTDEALHKWTLGPDDTRAIIGQALDAGINFFDTAMAYSFGTSEEYVGQALRELAPRDKWVIATKYSPRPKGSDDGVSGADYIRSCIDNSLRRLGVDTIDLYYMHSWDYATPIEESLEALNGAVTAGKVRALGVSNCHPYQLARANDVAAAHGWARFEAIQSHMNLIFREDERELLQLCREDGVSTMPYSALAAGTSLLPNISIVPPKKCIATNTVECMRSGAVYGTAAMIDGLIDRMEAELGYSCQVVATGGLASSIVPCCTHEIVCDDDLLLKGLWTLYQKNR